MGRGAAVCDAGRMKKAGGDSPFPRPALLTLTGIFIGTHTTAT